MDHCSDIRCPFNRIVGIINDFRCVGGNGYRLVLLLTCKHPLAYVCVDPRYSRFQLSDLGKKEDFIEYRDRKASTRKDPKPLMLVGATLILLGLVFYAAYYLLPVA